MTDQPSATHDSDSFPIDLSVARMARIENYLHGGDAHFAVDRAVADELAATADDHLEGLRCVVAALNAFVARAVRFLAGEAGIDQFLHIGMATPTDDEMVHDVALQATPRARVVYASYDPMTLAHAHTVRRVGPPGAVAHVQSAFDDPQKIIRAAAETLDLDRPMAVVLPATLNLIADDHVAQTIVDRLRDGIVAGSHVVLAHTTLDDAPESTEKIIATLNQTLDETYVARSATAITRLLTGLELLEPGLVPIEQWRNHDAQPTLASGHTIPILGAVGRKT